MKVLLSASRFHGFNIMIGKAFRELGCSVEFSNWPDLSGTIFYRSKLLLYEGINAKINLFDPSELKYKLLKETIIDYNKKLLQKVILSKPDILLVLKGDIILPRVIKKIREESNVISILWCYDSALRFSNVLNGGKYYHLFYTYEPTDMQELLRYNIRANFLPMAYDPDSYFSLKNKITNIDISFVGSLNDYPERKKILEKVISYYKESRVEIWGTAWTWYNPFLQYEYKIKRRALGKHIHNYDISAEEVNKVYNSTKICLNIHHPQSREGLNPRTFEILGAGGFELTDYKKVLEDLFDIGKELECYRNDKELLDKIEYYLENEDERKKIAQRGNKIVRKKHTYKHRAETILGDLETLM